MAKIRDIAEGIKIIRRYASYDELIGDNFQAQDGKIFCGKYSADKMSEPEAHRMKILGWVEEYDSWSFLT